jgi:hypothetical protein
MGVVDSKFVRACLRVKSSYSDMNVAIETGTNRGESTIILARRFPEVHTIEILHDLAAWTERRMAKRGLKNVHFHVGDSAICLARILPEISEQGKIPFIFLDAHWAGDATTTEYYGWSGYPVDTGHRAGTRTAQTPTAEQQVPLLDELKAIMTGCRTHAMILIDDMVNFDPVTGQGLTDVGFKGLDWTNLSIRAVMECVFDRLDAWIMTDDGKQLALFVKQK